MRGRGWLGFQRVVNHKDPVLSEKKTTMSKFESNQLKHHLNFIQFISLVFSFLILFFWPCCMACGILVPSQGLKLVPAVKMLSPYRWTTREFQYLPYFECLLLSPLNYSCRHLLGWLPTWSFYRHGYPVSHFIPCDLALACWLDHWGSHDPSWANPFFLWEFGIWLRASTQLLSLSFFGWLGL